MSNIEDYKNAYNEVEQKIKIALMKNPNKYSKDDIDRNILEYVNNDDKYGLMFYYMQITNCNDEITELAAEYKIDYLENKYKNNNYSYETPISEIPKCPKCGSTTITTGARGVNFTLGLIGASKTVNRCANCGHTWKPNGR